MGLQEVAFFDVDGAVHDQPTDLARLTGRHVRYAAVHAFALVDPDTGMALGSASWGNALLTREPIHDGFALGLPVGADDALVEPHGSDRPLAGIPFREAPYGTREPRCVVGGHIDVGGTVVSVLSTHLAYAGIEQRRDQAASLVDLLNGRDGPVVLLGDLNAAIEDPELASLRGAFTDAFEAVGVPAGDSRRQTTANARIDHALIRGLRVVDCAVRAEAGDASDHWPVAATLAIG